MTPTSSTVDDILDRAIVTAARIRLAVTHLDPDTRRSRTRSAGRFANQYELDLVADNIVHDAFCDFGGYVISEEREVDKDRVEENSLILVVDPVDGSTNAAHNLGYWSFSAALLSEGKVVGGVVVDQVAGRIFSATEDHGAILRDETGTVIQLERNEALNEDVGSLVDNFSPSVICFNSHEGPPIPFRHLRHFGSSALAICDVAANGCDAYIDDEDVLLKPWDLLASEYIARHSGATVKRRDSQGLMAATGVLVTKSENLLKSFETIFPHFFVN